MLPARLCPHPDGHELALNVPEALAGEVRAECPCCGARLWIAVPSTGALLEMAARSQMSCLPGLDLEFTPRERQVLAVLHRTPYALRSDQLAALVWSDPRRTHDVRSLMYRLRRKLRGSPWTIPLSASGQGVRLVLVGPTARAA